MQQETILRKCEAVLDLSSVYEKMVQLCSKEDSHPPLAPAFIVKYLLVSFLYSKPSNRQIGQRITSPQANEADELHAATSLQYLHHNCDVDVQCRLPVLSSSGQAFFAIVATNSFLLFFV